VGISKRHELRTKQILDETDIIDAFNEFPEYPKRISELIEAEYPKDIYASIVSSQFDADRLDYMRRDRLMSGTQQSGIDYDWLIANLHVRDVPIQLDGERVGKARALVIDEKSIVAAEGYVFSLLYLYINVYFHKTTRGLEKIFSALIELLAAKVREGEHEKSGLPKNHPLVAFLLNPDGIDPFLQIDDTVLMGSLSFLAGAKDASIAELAGRIRDRKVYTCLDVTKRMTALFGLPKEGSADAAEVAERSALVAAKVAKVGELAKERGLLKPGANGIAGILEDSAPRSPYKRVADGARAFSLIHVIGADDKLYDLADLSPAVNALGDYKAYRLYARSDSDRAAINQLIEDASK
jgi:HD superfamily phosphohydrolase